MSSLKDDIKKEISRQPKWRKLKEIEEDILEMIDRAIPLQKQVDLILKHGILDKLDRKEYQKIISRYFGYTGRRKKRVLETKTVSDPLSSPPQKVEVSPANKKGSSVEERLSKDVDLMGDFLRKKAQSL